MCLVNDLKTSNHESSKEASDSNPIKREDETGSQSQSLENTKKMYQKK